MRKKLARAFLPPLFAAVVFAADSACSDAGALSPRIDTLQETTYVPKPETVKVHDTTYDTTIVHDTTYDTTKFYDTTIITVPNTTYVSSGNDTLAVGTIFANVIHTPQFYGDKVTVTTIDPVYIIDNERYATFGASLVGAISEEVSGNVQLDDRRYVIDFDNLEKGSNLWLFNQITDFGRSMKNLDVILTPGFEGRVWYEKNAKENALTIHGTKSGEVSYRLRANRFDWESVATRDSSRLSAILLGKGKP